MQNIVNKFNLKIFDVQILNTHGGSIRFYISKKDSKHKIHKNVKILTKKESNARLKKFRTYKTFANRVKK